jgi:hypothetical protein
MRASLGVVMLAALALCARPCPAQDDARNAGGSNAGGPCVDVEVGNERVADLDCINRQLRLRVEREHDAPSLSAPIDARSSSTAVGTANQAAAEQMMGDAFGKSAHPQRPAPPLFVDPLAKPGAH